jgi:protein TonB
VNTPAPRAIAPTPAKAIAATHTTPPYPPLSRRLSEQGTVLLHIAVAEDGSVAQAMVEKSSGSERLDEAARDWVRQHWRYHPATHNGKPVASEMKVNVVFNLRVTR